MVKYIVRKLDYGYLRGIKKKVLYPQQTLILKRSINKCGLSFKNKFKIYFFKLIGFRNFYIKNSKTKYFNFVSKIILNYCNFQNSLKNFKYRQKIKLFLKNKKKLNFFYLVRYKIKHILKKLFLKFYKIKIKILEKIRKLILKKINKKFRLRFRFVLHNLKFKIRKKKIKEEY